MNNIWLIRHGATAGNLEKKYIGRTDEPLCHKGILQATSLSNAGFPDFDRVFVSPYLRCVQTVALAFPNATLVPAPGLRECDFGMFEGKNAAELADSETYARWLASGCTEAIPGGEDVRGFKARCCQAFCDIAAATQGDGPTAIVTHGGCIMAILERYAAPKRGFYDSYIPNCGWVRCGFDGERLALKGGALC